MSIEDFELPWNWLNRLILVENLSRIVHNYSSIGTTNRKSLLRKWNFKIEIPRSMGLFLVFWNILGLIIAANVDYLESVLCKRKIFSFPSNPINSTQQNPTIQLQTRMYFPRSFPPQNHYPGIFLFHDHRSLEDNDYFARPSLKGVVCLAISFGVWII